MRVGRSISLPKDHWQTFKEEAAKEGVSLSEWVGRACLASLTKEQRKTLSVRRGKGRPAQGTTK